MGTMPSPPASACSRRGASRGYFLAEMSANVSLMKITAQDIDELSPGERLDLFSVT